MSRSNPAPRKVLATEPCAAAAQVALHHLVDDLLRLHLERLRQRLPAAGALVGVERPALGLVPVAGEDLHGLGHAQRLLSVGIAVAAGCPTVPVACGSDCFSMACLSSR